MAKPPAIPLDEAARKEAKRAEALRANLRRRKASGAKPPTPETAETPD